MEPEREASGFRISCAIPAAISPTLANHFFLVHLLFHHFQLGQILKNADHADRLALIIA